MASKEPISSATKADYLKRAEMARKEAARAPVPSMRDGFLKLADEWERIAGELDRVNR